MAGNRKRRIVFLCSGGGGNLSFVHTAIQRSWVSDLEIVGVLTDRACPANQFADRFGIDNTALPIDKSDQRRLLSELERLNPDLILTTFNKILQPAVVTDFRDRLVNLHYSLLPSFSGSIGTRPVKDAIEYGSLISGVTVHSVSEEVDMGVPLSQVAIPIDQNDSVEGLMPIFFRCGGIALLKAITQKLSQGSRTEARCRTVLGRACLFSGEGLALRGMENDESLWQEVQASLRF